MSEDARAANPSGLIGPNAILQLLPQIERLGGPDRCRQMMAAAGVFDVPDGTMMIAETDAARLFRQLRVEEPELFPLLTRAAGVATADYILANRIPRSAQTVLKLLPINFAARALSQAISRHAWTFAGSGRFDVRGPWSFVLDGNPLIRGECDDSTLCHWHVGVFERLYQTLVHPDCVCVEEVCAAHGGGERCRFVIRRS